MKFEDFSKLILALGLVFNARQIVERIFARLFVTLTLFALSVITGIAAFAWGIFTAYLLLVPAMGQIYATFSIAAALAICAGVLWILARRSLWH